MEQVKSVGSGRLQTGITVTLALAMGLASLGTSIANIALPALADAFAAQFSEVQAVVVAYESGFVGVSSMASPPSAGPGRGPAPTSGRGW